MGAFSKSLFFFRKDYAVKGRLGPFLLLIIHNKYTQKELIFMNEECLDNVWKTNPEYIRKFYDNQPKNEKLCNEVKYILSMELNKANIEIAQITARTKTLKSFCEKITRKSYKNPFNEITDFAGARVVYLYSSNLEQIKSIIKREFKIIKKVDKVSSEEVDRFGYGALRRFFIRVARNFIPFKLPLSRVFYLDY